MMNTLRQEVLESQKVRSDLLTWKLILVAALGTAGLGFTKNGEGFDNLHLILCLIPFVCLYVDLLCRHLSLRVIVIGSFVRTYKPDNEFGVLSDYEKFINKVLYSAFTAKFYTIKKCFIISLYKF